MYTNDYELVLAVILLNDIKIFCSVNKIMDEFSSEDKNDTMYFLYLNKIYMY